MADAKAAPAAPKAKKKEQAAPKAAAVQKLRDLTQDERLLLVEQSLEHLLGSLAALSGEPYTGIRANLLAKVAVLRAQGPK